MKSILCYGDSNTWGFVPGSFGVRERFDRNRRWTGRLQQLLGTEQFYVIEEGLNNRTTNLDYTDKPPGFRGTELFLPILYTHAPLDLVIIMLGINDFKKEFNNRTTQHIAEGIKEHIEIVRSTTYGPNMKTPPAVLIVSTPMPVDTNCQDVLDMFKGAKERAQTLARDLKDLVDQYDEDVYFVDAAPHVQLSPVDGIHLDEKGHENLALLLEETVKKIFKEITRLNMSDTQPKTEEEVETTTEPKEPELPPEVDAFFKGKNKYKHPYGDWKPVIKVEPLKRKTFGDQLDLPTNNWHLPENQMAPVIQETKDDSDVKLVFKEREITSLPPSSSSKAGESVIFKKRKTASNRQLRGSSDRSSQKKGGADES